MVYRSGGKRQDPCFRRKANEPKSKVIPRIISKEEFFTMYPIYVRRCAGERVSQEAQAATRSQVYIYAIFANFCK